MGSPTENNNWRRGRARRLAGTAVGAAIVLASVYAAAPAMADATPRAALSVSQLQGSLAVPADTNDVPGSPFVTSGDSAPFDRNAAASWATDHAKDDEPDFPSCTWFVTQALWAAGIPKNPDWNSDGLRGWLKVPGTTSATAVGPFLEQLLTSYPATTVTGLSMTQNQVPQAQVGDLIVYSWTGEQWDHLSIITSITDDGYPNISEWGVYDWLTPRESRYTDRGWTWSKNSHGWLQGEYPQIDRKSVV